MKTYEEMGHTFTEEELRGDNPYMGSDGFSKEGFGFNAWAFSKAKFRYRLDQMTEKERKEAIAAHERFARKMADGCPVLS